jgi:hypothetical protein
MQYAIDAEGNYDVNGTKTDIFSFPTCSEAAPINITWAPQTDGTFTYTFDKAAIEAAVQINNFVLDSKTEHDAFKDCLTGNIVIWVTDGTPAGA